MTRRQLLTWSVVGLSIVGVVGLAVPFLRAIAPARTGTLEVEFPVLREGHPVVLDIDGFPLIILKPDPAQLTSIHSNDAHVANRDYLTYRSEIGAFVYWGVSTRRERCAVLEYKPAQPSLLAEWRSDALWLGGYWDPICEVSYDYAGRALINYEVTYNGFYGEYPNLNSPLVVEKIGNNLRVSRYGRPRFLTKTSG